MIHHVLGAYHYAHSDVIDCEGAHHRVPPEGEWTLMIQGLDGKCDWCRQSDANWDRIRTTQGEGT